MRFERDIAVIEEVVLHRDPAFRAVPLDDRKADLHALRKIDKRHPFLLAAMALVARAGNAHSRIIPNGAIDVLPHRIILRGGAPALLQGTVTRPILAVNDVPVSQLIDSWQRVLAGNPARQRVLSGIMLAWPEALAFAGVVGGQAVTYQLDGGADVVCDPNARLPALPLFPVSDTGFPRPDEDAHSLASGALYDLKQGLLRIRIAELKSLDQRQVDTMIGQLPTLECKGAVVDLRGNPGGDFTKMLPLVDWLDRHVDRCAVLVNEYTFSAAIVATVLITHRLGQRAHVFGAEMGDDLQFWAEGGTLDLDQCGAALRYSTAWHDWKTGQPDHTTPTEIATHMIAAGPVEVVRMPEPEQLGAACAFALGA